MSRFQNSPEDLVAHQAAVKNKILDAAAVLFARDARATLADVGRAVGLRKSIVHYYFVDKFEFVRETYKRAVDQGTSSIALHASMIVLAQRDAFLRALVYNHAPLKLDTRAALGPEPVYTREATEAE